MVSVEKLNMESVRKLAGFRGSTIFDGIPAGAILEAVNYTDSRSTHNLHPCPILRTFDGIQIQASIGRFLAARTPSEQTFPSPSASAKHKKLRHLTIAPRLSAIYISRRHSSM